MDNLGYTVPLSYSGPINLVQVGPCPFDNPRSVVGVCNRLVGADVYYHFDLKYSLTKYLAYTPEVKSTILKRMSELVNIKSESFRGVVVHTSCPYPDSSFGVLFPEEILKAMDTRIYDIATLSKYYPKWKDLALDSLGEFAKDLVDRVGTLSIPIYLENVVDSTPRWSTDNFFSLLEYIRSYGIYGVCVDTEHLYASNGISLPGVLNLLRSLSFWGTSMLVHLNAIPKSVRPGRRLDRHSNTSLSECSVNSFEDYISFVYSCKDLGVPCIREVSQSVMEFEISKLCLNL